MLLKRLYRDNVVSGVKMIHAGSRQNFSSRFVEGGVAEGWLSGSTDKLVIHAESGDVVYAIERVPGYYCCHCGRKMDDGAGAKVHIESAHPGRPSPDAVNPSGYLKSNAYECTMTGGAAPKLPGRTVRSTLRSWLRR